MLKVTDDRLTDINLCNVEIGECFIWKDELYQRVVLPTQMDKGFIEAFAGDELACIHLEAGLLIGIDRLALVEPVDAEVHIIGE